MAHIYQCSKCRAFTLSLEHCEMKTLSVKPARFSPGDKYAPYVREAKAAERKEQGLL